MSDWTQELQLKFLEAFQGEPVIWDPKHASHKDKKKINDAWGRIENEIGKPTKELKSKKDSLMATYRGYCRKISASIKSGASSEDVYKPVWFAFQLMDHFLGSVYSCGATINTQEEASNLEIVDHEAVIDNESDIGELRQNENNLNHNRPATGKTIRRRADPPELQDAAKQMKNAFDTLNNVLKKKNDVEDEDDVFGKLIAKKLKRLSQDDKEDVMFEIEKIFHNKSLERRRFLSNYSNNSTSPSLTSPHSVYTMSPPSPSVQSTHSFQQPIVYENPHSQYTNLSTASNFIQDTFRNS